MNPGQAIQTAVASYDSAIRLNRTLQSTIGESQAPPTAEVLKKRALLQVVVIMASFAIEMGLKAILSQEKVSFRKIHDLLSLYHRIPFRVRAQIDEIARREDVSMNGVCDAHRNSFTDWRYAAEERPGRTEFVPCGSLCTADRGVCHNTCLRVPVWGAAP